SQMNPSENSVAFGAPGIEPRWTSSAKEGVGTAYHTSCRLWFTLSHGIVNEIYYPHVDQPNTRDFQFLISDGETFCHEEKRDLTHNFKMDWEFNAAENGNIALTAEVELRDDSEFTVAVALGRSYQSAATKLFQSLAEPFKLKRESYIRQWQRAVIDPKFDFTSDTTDDGGMYRLSRCVLLAHEDKVFQGAI